MATIIMFAGNFAPKYWALCNGAILNISSNTALFSLIGTTYGGNGMQTFALPDLRGRVAVGAGQGPGLSLYSLGQVGGYEAETLTVDQLPPHNHSGGSINIDASGDNASLTSPVNNMLALSNTPLYSPAASISKQYGDFSVQTTVAGNSEPLSIVQPYLSVYYVICTQGIFPQRP